jgi:hypothetical protein
MAALALLHLLAEQQLSTLVVVVEAVAIPDQFPEAQAG